MEANLDIEFLKGIGPDSIIKELALASNGIIKNFSH